MKQHFMFLLVALGLTGHAQSVFVPSCQDWPSTQSANELFFFSDLDGNGFSDLVAFAGKKVFVYQNQGGVVDQTPTYLFEISPYDVSEIHALDWNQDGKPDILVKLDYDETLNLFLNQGNFSFSLPIQFQGLNSQTVTVGNLDGDLFPDIALWNSTNEFRFLLNHSGVATPDVQDRQINTEGLYRTMADIDLDGIADLVISVGSIPWPTSIEIYANDGNFNFTQVNTLSFTPASINPLPLTGFNVLLLADLDLTNGPELIIKHHWKTYIYRHLGGFNFSAQMLVGDHNYNTTGYIEFSNFLTVVPDLDGNGFPEIAVDNSLFFNNNLSFTEKGIVSNPDFGYVRYVAVDADLDGKQELWWIQSNAGLFHQKTGVFRVLHTGGQSLAPREWLWEMFPVETDWPLTWTDIDQDGDPDIVYRSFRKIVVSENVNGSFKEKTISGAGWNASYSLFDIDSDGFDDLLQWTEPWYTISWGKNPGSLAPFQGQPVIYSPGNNKFQFLGGADFNLDGKKDLLISDLLGSIAARLVWLQYNDTTLVTGGTGFIADLATLSSGKAHIADVNSDAYPDVVFWYENKIKVYHNASGGALVQVQDIALGGNSSLVGMEDMNLDGKADIVVISSGKISFLPALGNGKFGAVQQTQTSASGGFLSDLNNDHLVDFIQRNPFAVAFHTGTGFTPLAVQGQNFVAYTVEDIDHDGDSDIRTLNADQLCNWENTHIGPHKIVGKTFFDLNGNGISDAGEPPLQGYKISMDQPAIYAISDSSGNFTIPLGAQTGNFTVQLSSPNSIYFNYTTPYPAQALISSNAAVDTVQIGVQIASGKTGFLDQTISSHRCNETARLWLNWEVIQPFNSPGQLSIQLPPGVGYVPGSAGQPPAQVNGNQLQWTFGSVAAFEPGKLKIDLKMPDFQAIGDTLRYFAVFKTWSGTDTLTLRDTLFTILTCAYDPNDKTIAKAEDFFEGDHFYYRTTAPDQVEYQIRFQNTGNSFAEMVTIFDNLPQVFDFSSLEFISGSHHFRGTLEPTGLLKLEFPDIHLPDSASDFLGSMGFVKFRLKLSPPSPRNQFIANAARIVFDQNPPVLTNQARMAIVDCNFFAAATIESPRCIGDSILVTASYLGIPQEYLWTIEGNVISQIDTAEILVQSGSNYIRLQVENKLCNADSIYQVGSTIALPNLVLNLSGDTAFCAGYPLVVTSNLQLTKWYRNDTLVQSSGTSYTANVPQVLTVTAANGVCVAQKAISIEVFDPPASLIQEYYPETTPTCAGDTIHLTSALNRSILWYTFFGNGNESTQTALSLHIPTTDNPVTIAAILDTLNCRIEEVKYFQLIPDDQFQLLADTVVCQEQLFGTYFYCLASNSVQMPVDSIFIYNNGALWFQDGYQSSGSWFLQNVPLGVNQVEIHTACYSNTLNWQVYAPDQVEVGLIEGPNGLYSIHQIPGTWYFAIDLNTPFQAVQFSGFELTNPQVGYYYLECPLNNCLARTDTVFYDGVISTEDTSKGDIMVNFDFDENTLLIKGNLDVDAVYQLFDASGRSVETGKAMPITYFQNHPKGVYFCMVRNGKQQYKLKIPLLR